MMCYGLDIAYKNIPVLDREFIPMHLFNTTFLKHADKPVGIAIERSDGQVAAYRTSIRSAGNMRDANIFFISRFIKTMLWMKGGFRIYLSGDEDIYRLIKRQYGPGGAREFDSLFMARVYERDFEVQFVSELPAAKETSHAVGRHLNGCRIGFDAGGSDRKVSAVVDGETVYSEEVVWHPKLKSDPDYHFNEIVAALSTAASHLPRVDGIGISSAGVCIHNRLMVSSLFTKVPSRLFDGNVKDIYLRAGKRFGDIPIVVCNDGDVTALSGAMNLDENNVLGIAMGTSEAAGYVNGMGNITGWLNELAFVPVDANPNAIRDEWSGDIGCGVKYLSQDSVIKLACAAGIPLTDNATPAEKLVSLQKLMENGDPNAIDVFASLGVYLGHTLPFYYDLYGFRNVLLLGRVMSGKGGNLILEEARRVLHEEYPEIAGAIRISLPDEKSRRIGQAVAAASLPVIEV